MDVNQDIIAQAEFLHLTSFVNNEQLEVQKKMVGSLGESTKLSFSPGSLYAKKGIESILSIIEKTHVIFLNEAESMILTDCNSYTDAAQNLIEMGCKIAVVTLGEKGCYISDGSRKVHVEAFEVDVLDTTGAGDAFCAGFLYGLSMEKEMTECGKIGNFVASRCISRIGARTGLLSEDELKEGIIGLI
jgi:ribokinase